jgi:hypothetical protein
LLEILKYLRAHGEQLDSEIATGTGMSLKDVRLGVSDMSARGEIVTCRVSRFKDGKRSDGILYRAAGYIPPHAPGRKPKAQARGGAGAQNPE